MFENQGDSKRLMLFFLVMAAFVIGRSIFLEAVVKPRSYEKSFENAIQVTNINPEQILITYMKKNNTNYSVEHKKVRTLEQAQPWIKAMKQRGGMYFSLTVEGMEPGRMSKTRIQRLKEDIFRRSGLSDDGSGWSDHDVKRWVTDRSPLQPLL